MNILQPPSGGRRPKLTINIPNILTVLRILITPLFVILLIRDLHGYALLLFVLAGVSDGLDGLIARMFNQRSDLGAVLDPIADKLLLTAAYLSLGILKDIPGWLVVVVISRDVGGQTAWSGDVENYTGYQFISGPELVAKFEEHMKANSIPLREGETVLEVRRKEGSIYVHTDQGDYRSRSLIIASGKRSRELNVPGEKELKNRGLTYCATCAGPLFAGKDVAVIGGGNSALDAALQLMRIAKFTYVLNSAPALTGDRVMSEKVSIARNVRVMHNVRILSVMGNKFVTGIKIDQDGREDILAVQGVFVEIGLVPNADICPEVIRNQWGEIKVNCRNETNLPGIFAAGDVTDVPAKQIIVAAAEGAKPCLSAFHYLSVNKF